MRFTEKKKYCTFGKLGLGEVFGHNINRYYMVIKPVIILESKDYKREVNAIGLEYGSFVFFDENELVEKLDGTFVVS